MSFLNTGTGQSRPSYLIVPSSLVKQNTPNEPWMRLPARRNSDVARATKTKHAPSCLHNVVTEFYFCTCSNAWQHQFLSQGKTTTAQRTTSSQPRPATSHNFLRIITSVHRPPASSFSHPQSPSNTTNTATVVTAQATCYNENSSTLSASVLKQHVTSNYSPHTKQHCATVQ